MKHRRLLCLLLALLLLCTLAPGTGSAEPTVYFTSVNDQLLPDLSDDTMPFWSGGRLYVPYTAVSGTDLGVFYARSRDAKTAVVYRQGSALTFDLSAGTATDQSGRQYGSPAIVRGDVVFLPVELLTQFFSLDYSYTRVNYGYLVRLKSDTVVLSDAKFIEAAASSMEQRYNEYMKTYNSGRNDDNTPSVNTDDSVDRAYLLVRVTDAASGGALLDALASPLRAARRPSSFPSGRSQTPATCCAACSSAAAPPRCASTAPAAARARSAPSSALTAPCGRRATKKRALFISPARRTRRCAPCRRRATVPSPSTLTTVFRSPLSRARRAISHPRRAGAAAPPISARTRACRSSGARCSPACARRESLSRS